MFTDSLERKGETKTERGKEGFEDRVKFYGRR